MRGRSISMLLVVLLSSGEVPAESGISGNLSLPDDSTWHAVHKRHCECVERDRPRLVLLGGTTLAGFAERGAASWNQQIAPRGAVNAAIAGDDCQRLLWRIENSNLRKHPPKLVILLPDANSGATAEGLRDMVSLMINQLRDQLPEAQVLILGLRPRTGTDPLQVAEANRLISHLADWQQVHFLDVGHEFNDSAVETEEASGELSAEGFARLSGAIDFKVAELMDEETGERISLFDGVTLAGWQAGDDGGAPRGWRAVDGTLAIVGRGDDAQTERKFRNFNFQCEWKVQHRGNSGIFYRWADYAGYVSAGPEYQVIDDIGRKLPADRDNSVGATVDMYGPAADKPTRKAGQWNHTRIVAVDGEVEHWLNGIRVVNFDITSPEWTRRLKKSKFRRLWPFGRLYEGAFRLQNYGGMPVVYRDLTVAVL